MIDFFLGITNKCNLRCPWCAHGHLRRLNETYEMSVDEFERWFDITKSAGYYFESIDFNGLGEPTEYSDFEFLQYMLVRSRTFSGSVNILTNGMNFAKLEKLVPLCDNMNISVYPNNIQMLKEFRKFESVYPSRVHVRENIILHDFRETPKIRDSNSISVCGCSGCGYTMGTVFLVCGTWCPEIVKNDVYHCDLKPYYLDSLDAQYGYCAYDMCKRCHANTHAEYKKYDGM